MGSMIYTLNHIEKCHKGEVATFQKQTISEGTTFHMRWKEANMLPTTEEDLVINMQIPTLHPYMDRAMDSSKTNQLGSHGGLRDRGRVSTQQLERYRFLISLDAPLPEKAWKICMHHLVRMMNITQVYNFTMTGSSHTVRTSSIAQGRLDPLQKICTDDRVLFSQVTPDLNWEGNLMMIFETYRHR
jgi:hypothetical protein